jgi:excisionase family DNA binding protein
MRIDTWYSDVDDHADDEVALPASGTGGRFGRPIRPTSDRSRGMRSNRSESVGIDRALTIREAAQVLGVSYATVRRLLLENKISFQRVSPRRTVIRESALLDYLQAMTAEATRSEDYLAQAEELPDRCLQGCERLRPN